MTRDFYALLGDAVDDSLRDKWKLSFIKKVEVYNSRAMWRMHISVNTPVDRPVIVSTASQLQKKFPFLQKIQILPVVEDLEHSLKIILYKHKDDLVTAFPDYAAIEEHINWQVEDGKLNIIAPTHDTYNYILEKEICSRLTEWFWQKYLLQIIVRVLAADIHHQEEESLIQFVPRQKLEVLQPMGEKKPSLRKGRKPSQENSHLLNLTPIKICELEEGLKSAVVEGELWDQEATRLKDGRYAITWYLTDYTDSVIVKSFWDNLEDDKLNLGEWVRVKGSVRYDEFCKEPVLFMEAFVAAEKRKRIDSYEEKRIELHVHTKMSAMDGLTEIPEIIKRAAEWGHPAIAITDHGCTQAFPEVFQACKKYGVKVIYGVEGYLVEEDKKEKPYHIIILARNQEGLKNLYQLVSISYLHYYYRHPKIPRRELNKFRNGLLLGTACEAGELYTAIIRGEKEEELERIASFYDYLEIQPLCNNEFLIREGRVKDQSQLMAINKTILNLGKKLGKPVVGTGDVHFLDPEHEIFRRIIQAGQGYEEGEAQTPLYFKTTNEMMDEFAYLGQEDAEKVVIHDPAIINQMIEHIKPVPDGFFPPKIDSAEEEIIRLTWQRAHLLYGEELLPEVKQRIEHELDAITRHGFSVLYLIAHKLVKKSNEDGYLVGSRGSVGSSLVAFLTGITEVNPLPPHYLCPQCHHCIFVMEGTSPCGADLPEKNCPECGNEMSRYGFNIPFETFLGFEGDKIPDIDLNFSGDYQNRAHQYVEELFGRENVFRAGTISTIAEKTAFGFVKKYEEERSIYIKNSEINRLVKGITGVRRTTGQHPGGLIVVPRDRDIYEFTPLQHPADNKDSGVITTHFEYHAIGDQLVKLDILGHDDPTVIKQLEDLTGFSAAEISLSDQQTMKIFSGLKPLNITEEMIGSSVGTFGIPEFGTKFVRQILEMTKPTTFMELVRICGLSHGTDVWLNNAQGLVQSGTATLNEVICTRDDIMTYLIQKGIDKRTAFKIMENVRKGRGLTQEEKTIMEEYQIPSWYIDSCQRIKYMFPKAHAVAYVTMAFRIAYFKVNYPLAFYASFFSVRAEDFDYQSIMKGYDGIKAKISEIEKQGNAASQKDKKLLPILEVALEMYCRGFKFYPVDIYQSDVKQFKIKGDGLIPPFSALPNIGVNAAIGILLAREKADFISCEDFQQRTHLNRTAMEVLRENGCLDGLPESSQISLFG